MGAQLAALHATPVPMAPQVDLARLSRQLAGVVEVLAVALPDQAGDLRRTAARLEAGLQHLAAWPTATLHGDLHPRNLLVDGERLTLIDLDDLQRGPALLELGAWVADGIYRALLDGAPPTRDQVGWHELLHAYAASAGRAPSEPELAWATAWSLLTQRAWRCVVNLKPGRWAIAPRLIGIAAQWVGEPALEPA